MSTENLKVYGLIVALQIEVEGFKAANLSRQLGGHSFVDYEENYFQNKADQIRELVKLLQP